MHIDMLNKNKSNRYFRGTPRGGSKVFVFNEDFEELRHITHDDFDDPADEVMMENSQEDIVPTEQSEFRKLPLADSFDSMNDKGLGKNEPFRN